MLVINSDICRYYTLNRTAAKGGDWGPPFHLKILQFARVFEKKSLKNPLEKFKIIPSWLILR